MRVWDARSASHLFLAGGWVRWDSAGDAATLVAMILEREVKSRELGVIGSAFTKA